jgi:hypothetical protein
MPRDGFEPKIEESFTEFQQNNQQKEVDVGRTKETNICKI